MNVSLTPQLEEYVTSKVREGLYRTNSEVVRQGLRLLIEREQLLETRLKGLGNEVALGLGQARNGELIPVKEVEVRLKARAEAKAG